MRRAVVDRARAALRRSLAQNLRVELLENRVLLSAGPAASVMTMIDHSTGFGDTTDMRLNGNNGLPAIASVNDASGNNYPAALQLTNGMVGETSTAFNDPPPDGTSDVLGIDTFDTTFDFTYGSTTPPKGDGMTFTLQNDPNKALALGFGGGSLGYQNIHNSVCVKFDLYNAGKGVSTTGVYVGGVLPADTPVKNVDSANPAATGTSIDLTKNADGSATGIDFQANPDDLYRAHLVYDGTILTEMVTDVTLNKSATQKYTVNIPAAVNGHTAFAGFTGATGGAVAEQDIVSWKFTGVQTSGGLVALPAPNLFATPCEPGTALLAWSNVSGNETGFEIDRSSNGTTFTPITTVPHGTINFTDTGLDQTKTYSYKIKAQGDNTTNADSPFSTVVTASGAGLTPMPIAHATGFSGATDVALNGSAKILANNALQLTSGQADGESGSAFATKPQLVNKFDTSFDFTFGSAVAPDADGFTFTIQADTPDIRGGGGGGLGYVNIPNSLAVKFDLYDSAAATPTTYSASGVYLNGLNPDDDPRQAADPTTPVVIMTGTNGPSIDLKTDAQGNPTGIDFHANPSDTYHVHLVYDGTTLTETVTDVTKNATVQQAYTIDIPGMIGSPCALVGFTGGTGGARAEQDILNWTFPTATAPTRLPADFNNDGKVDFSDLLILAQNYGKTTGVTQNTGDANNDQKVNFSDLLILAQEYGKISTAARRRVIHRRG